MRAELNVSIPKPCHENWENMSPNQKGRHCKACEKTVVDFTPKTDEQIVSYFLEHNNICGRFKNQQLNRLLVFARKSKNNYWSFLASGLLAFLSLVPQETKAQGHTNATIQTDSTSQLIKGKIAHSVLKTKTISGLVLDEIEVPLPFVNVTIKGSKKVVITDFDGKFSIKVDKNDVLEFSSLGFTTQSINVNKIDRTCLNIKLIPDELDLMGDVILEEVPKKAKRKKQ